MLALPAARFTATTVLQYAKRSNRTRQAPAGSASQAAKLSSSAICSNAPSALSSKTVEYGVALIASIRPVKSGWKVKKAFITCSGDKASVRWAASASGERCCSQYQSQVFDRSIIPHTLSRRIEDTHPGWGESHGECVRDGLRGEDSDG